MKVVVVGSMNMDYRLLVDHVPGPGETILSGSLETALGGKGLNQATAARRSGAEVAFIGCVGSDENGARIRSFLQEEGVDASGIREVDLPTGCAYIAVDEEGMNTIIVYSGSNYTLDEAWAEKNRARIAAADVCVMQMEIPLPTIYAVLQICREEKVPVVLNPSPMQEAFDRKMLQWVDTVVVNEHELRQLSQKKEKQEAMETLLSMGVKHILYTSGDEGSEYYDATTDVFAPARKVKVVDTTGAGDTYLGAFVSQMGTLPDGEKRTEAVEAAMRYATAAAGLAVTRLGAIPSIPERDEILEIL